jgi:hypothetical protein
MNISRVPAEVRGAAHPLVVQAWEDWNKDLDGYNIDDYTRHGDWFIRVMKSPHFDVMWCVAYPVIQVEQDGQVVDAPDRACDYIIKTVQRKDGMFQWKNYHYKESN